MEFDVILSINYHYHYTNNLRTTISFQIANNDS